jgi:hypothetical protein
MPKSEFDLFAFYSAHPIISAMLPEMINAFQKAINAAYHCESQYVESLPVREGAEDGQIAWDGVVEVFRLFGHQKALFSYAWRDEKDATGKIICVLKIPPVDSARVAVRMAIAAAANENQSGGESGFLRGI